MFAALRADEAMVGAVRRAKAAGVRTALVSNSWGDGMRYDEELLRDGFDAVVLSHELRIRKPDPGMFLAATERLGLPPETCVFVDDLPFNLEPAAALGMATVLHRDAATTLPRLETLLGVALR
nr:HAD-IA family hydrolase [Patulibacter sp. SYSU D01012]